MKIDLIQLEFITLSLRKMALDVEEHFAQEFTVTSLYRIGDYGVHGQLPLRGIDLRCLDPVFGAEVENYVNAKYIYDPKRPLMKACMFHDIGHGAHLHLQVHPNTVLREELNNA